MEEFVYPKSVRDVAGHVIIARHYYGTLVRELFLVAGVLILVGLPVFSGRLNIPVLASILGVIVIASLAGLTSRKQRFVVGLDAGASLIGLLVYEVAAVTVYQNLGATDSFFWFNQILAILFFFIFYFAVKTFRGMVIEHIVPEEEEK